MAEVTQVSSGGKHKKGKMKKMSTRVDLTPMVDLAFLLITFFMLTTTLIKPQTMEISMPSKKNIQPKDMTKVKASQAMTIIIGGKDSLFYYFGTRIKNVNPPFIQTDYSPDGIRKVLLQKNATAVVQIAVLKKKLDARQIADSTYKREVNDVKAAKNGPVILIKAFDDATYNDLVEILDEMNICNIGRYAIEDITPFDKELLDNYRKGKK